MSAGDLFAQYPGLNPAVWRPLIGFEGEPPADVGSGGSAQQQTAPRLGAEQGQTEIARAKRRGADFALPCAAEYSDGIEFPEQKRAGAAAEQLSKAAIMHAEGLKSKARRQASCGVYGRLWACENEHQMYQRFFCKNRYCPNPACGRRFFLDLFNKYIALSDIADRMAPNWEHRPARKSRAGDFVIAKIDITSVNTGRMPTRAEVQVFNRNIRRLFKAAAEEFGLTHPKKIKCDGHLVPERDARAGDYGVLWTDEFGGRATRPGRRGNTNLHAHAVYAGPFLPQSWLSAKWAEICGDGSKIVSIKLARTFRAGLYHALKYAGKFLSTDPARLAELELAFDRVRRVHAMGGFYNAIPRAAQQKCSPRCPHCHGVMLDATGPLRPVGFFEMQGIRDFDVVSHEAGRERVFTGNANGCG